jgi:hypothetical protein
MDQMGGEHSETSFISHMTELNDKDKASLLNLAQYTVVAILPLIIFIYIMKNYLPKFNEHKGSLEILIEVVLQLVLVILVFWVIHRFILFLSVYSGVAYENINLLNIVLPVIFILFTLDTNVSKKMNLIVNRVLIYLGFNPEAFGLNEYSEIDEDTRINTLPALAVPPPNVAHMSPPQNTQNETVKSDYNMQPQEPSIPEPMAANSFSDINF